jgi:hypothetical protein
VRDFEIVAGIFAAVFILGIGVGVIMVIALSVLRHHRATRQRDTRRRTPGGPQYNPTRPWEAPPGADHPRRPQWPGDGGFED